MAAEDLDDWDSIQDEELAYHLRKDKDKIREYKIPYWKSFLEKVAPYVTVGEQDRVLEIGCGCCGIVMALDQGELYGLDPLMDKYCEHFDYLKEARPTWINSPAEEAQFDKPFDVVFNINALDHVIDPVKAARKMCAFLKPGGHLVLNLNCHETRFFRWYHPRFFRFIDPHHPHHFNPGEVVKLFGDLELLMQEDIDDLYFPSQDGYKREVLQRKGIRWDKVKSYLLNPFKYPVALARILGKRPVHRSRPGQKAIFASYLFVFRKPETKAT